MNDVYVIAEAGVNHNGSLAMAKSLVDAAVHSGADAIKFQTFNAKKLVSEHADKADYQKQTTTAEESQLDMIQKLELNHESHMELFQYCQTQNIQFLSTPFDVDSLHFLVNHLDVPRLKVSSGDLTNPLLLLKMAQTKKPIILSTGMSILGDVEMALGVLAFGYTVEKGEPSTTTFKTAYVSDEGQTALQENVTVLHCTTEYPTPFTDVNLKAMDTLQQAFGLPVGFSDHTKGIVAPLAAVARGAMVVEKHFTLDRNLPGPDHQASLEPNELETMVTGIRQVSQSLGAALKRPAASEVKNMIVARRSLIASQSIRKGEVFTEANLTVKRPGHGIPSMFYFDWLGKIADRDYAPDELIQF